MSPLLTVAVVRAFKAVVSATEWSGMINLGRDVRSLSCLPCTASSITSRPISAPVANKSNLSTGFSSVPAFTTVMFIPTAGVIPTPSIKLSSVVNLFVML